MDDYGIDDNYKADVDAFQKVEVDLNESKK